MIFAWSMKDEKERITSEQIKSFLLNETSLDLDEIENEEIDVLQIDDEDEEKKIQEEKL